MLNKVNKTLSSDILGFLCKVKLHKVKRHQKNFMKIVYFDGYKIQKYSVTKFNLK